MIQYAIAALIDFSIAFLAISKSKTTAARALSLTAFSFGLWTTELFLLTTISDANTLDFWFHLTRWGMFFIPSTLALLAWQLIDSNSIWFSRLVVMPGIAASCLLCISNMFLFPSTLSPTESGFLPKTDLIYKLFAVLFICCIISSIVFCSIKFRNATLRQKNRIKWLGINLIVTGIAGALSIYLMTYDFYLSKFIGSAVNILFISLLFYSTIQHHLMDLSAALSEGIPRALTIGMFIWLYLFLNTILDDLVPTEEKVVIMLMFFVVVLEAYPRILKSTLPETKRIFSRNNLNAEKILGNLEKDLNDCISQKLLKIVCDRLFSQTLKIRNYEIRYIKNNSANHAENRTLASYADKKEDVIFSDESPFEIREILTKLSASSYMLICYDGSSKALITIGKPKNSHHYSYDQIRIFQWLGSKLADVLYRIKHLESMEEELENAKKKLSILSVINQYHHDIKAPLAIIDGVITADVYDKKKQKKVVLEQVDRASKLITTIAEILHGNRKREIAAVDMANVIKESISLFAHSIDSVIYKLDDMPNISGEQEDLKILVLNIIKNSIEAKRDGYAIRLTISAWTEQHGLFIKFEDNGVGMPKEQLEQIWTAHTSTKPTGSGIGLQAVKRIADDHDATVNVVSSVDTGTAFTFTFPASVLIKSKKRKAGKIIDGGWPTSRA